MSDFGVITNPNSRRNSRIPDPAKRLARRAGSAGIVCATRDLDDLRCTLARLAGEGIRFLVCDGGDGTLHWVLNEARAVWPDFESEPPVLIPTTSGTVGFVARKIGARGDSARVVKRLAALERKGGEVRVTALDTIEVKGWRPGDPQGRPSLDRIGFAAAIGGIGQRFFDTYYRTDGGISRVLTLVIRAAAEGISARAFARRLDAFTRRRGGTLAALIEPTRARVEVDGERLPYEEYRALHAGSIDVRIGPITLFPYARDDRAMHVAAGDIDPGRAVFEVWRMFRGETPRGADWHERTAAHLRAEASGDELFSPIVDGEVFEGLAAIEVTLGPAVPFGRV